MRVEKFPGYGVGSSEKSVVLDKIVYWQPINFNGVAGTEITFDCGTTLRVGVYPCQVDAVFDVAEFGPEP